MKASLIWIWLDALDVIDVTPPIILEYFPKYFVFRYLDAYEKFYFLREEEEDESNPYFDEEDGRARRERQRRIGQNVPTSYNESQHRVSGE